MGGQLTNEQKSTVWSGAPFGILSSLCKLTDVEDFDLKKNFSDNLIVVYWKVKKHIEKTNDFLLQNSYIGDRQIERLIKENRIAEGPILSVLEYSHKRICDSYMYQDFTADYIVRYAQQHEDLQQYLPYIAKTSPKIAQMRVEGTSKIYSECAGVFTMGEYLAKDLVENSGIDPRKVHAVGGGCNIDISRIDGSKKQGNKFLFNGKDFIRKNGPLVVRAFLALREKYHDIELHICGPEKAPDEIKELSLSDGIVFRGLLKYDELVDEYNECDYFVLPSLVEGYGFVFGEALIFGLPCIGRDAFAMPDFIEDGFNGYLCHELSNANELYNCMEKCLLNADTLMKEVKNQRNNYLEKYSWDGVAKRMLDIMRHDGYNLSLK